MSDESRSQQNASESEIRSAALHRRFPWIVGVMAGWLAVLTWYVFRFTQETGRMLCHANFPTLTIAQCRDQSAWGYSAPMRDTLIILLVMSLLCFLVLMGLLFYVRRPPAER
jgi:hypothetical protein